MAERRWRGRAGLVAGVATAAVAASLLVAPTAPATAAVGDAGSSRATTVFATAGTGTLRDQISWFTWGTAGSAVASGTSTTNWVQVSDVARVEVTCTLTTVSGGVSAYRPGSYAGDGLDDMYYVGGTGTSNQLVVGLVNGASARTDTVDIVCAAALVTYDGSGFAAGNRVSSVAEPLPGLVLADAESMGGGESIVATPLTNTSATWRIIDRNNGCSTSSNMTAARSAAGALTIASAGSNQCTVAPGTATVVSYLDGDTSVRVAVQGSGLQAFALGYLPNMDYGDAPQTYGVAGAYNRTWTASGAVTSTTATAVAGPTASFTLGTFAAAGTTTAATPRLGPTLTVERYPLFSATATGDSDNAFGTAPGALTTVTAGVSTLTLSPRCRAPGYVQGWIDWNDNGVFDAAEASTQAQCTSPTTNGTAVALTWNVPNDARGGTTFARFVVAGTQAELAPTGIMSSGEVEDFQVTANVRALQVTKAAYLDAAMTVAATAVPAIGDVVYYRLVLTNVGNQTFDTTNPAYLYDDVSAVVDDATIGTLATSPTTYGSATSSGTRISFAQSAGTLAVGGTVTITYRMTVTSAGDGAMTNVARASGTAITAGTAITCDAGSADQLAGSCARVDLLTPTATVTKTASVDAIPNVGGSVAYTLTVTNTGTVAFTADQPARVFDYYGGVTGAAGGTPVASAATGTTAVDTTNRLVTWSGPLAAGASVAITVTFTVTLDTDNATMTNVARVTKNRLTTAQAQAVCSAGDLAASTCATHLLQRARVRVTKTAYSDAGRTTTIASNAALAPGATVYWSYLVRNTGSAPLTNLILTDVATDTKTAGGTTTSTTSNPTITCPGYTAGASVTITSLAAGTNLTCTASGTIGGS